MRCAVHASIYLVQERAEAEEGLADRGEREEQEEPEPTSDPKRKRKRRDAVAVRRRGRPGCDDEGLF